MLLIPAIDLKGGNCVRLRQGNMDDETIYSENPVEMAKHWESMGARRLHIVDLDGAFSGKPENIDIKPKKDSQTINHLDVNNSKPELPQIFSLR